LYIPTPIESVRSTLFSVVLNPKLKNQQTSNIIYWRPFKTQNVQIYKKSSKITKEVIKIHKSKKDRQHNRQKKKDKGTNTDLQNITNKIKDRVTPLKTGVNSGSPKV